MATDDLAWIMAVRADDLRGFGVEQFDDETPAQALTRLAEEMDVDLHRVGRCLALLKQEPCVLAGGAPMAVLGYSPRSDVFRSSYDGDLSEDLALLDTPRAGVWLTLLSMEAGELPDHPEHWLVTRLLPRVSAANPDVIDLAQSYARWSIGDGPQGLDAHDQRLGRAFWRCAAHRLR